MPRNSRKVRAWQLADDLTIAVYELTARFPRHEVYGLTQQLRRAAVSVPSNIAEGCRRESKADYLRLCDIARGSLSELRYQLHLAHRLRYIPDAECAGLEEQAEAVAKTLHGLMESVRRESR